MTKTRRIRTTITIVLFLSLILIVGLMIKDEKAYAESEQFNYFLYFTYNQNEVYKGSSSHVKNATDVLGANIAEEDDSLFYNLKLKVTADKNFKGNNASIGENDFIKGSRIILSVDTNYPQALISIYYSNGALCKQQNSNNIELNNLRDDKYIIKISLKGNEWNKTIFNKAYYEVEISSVINIDNTAPSLSNLSQDKNIKYSNEEVFIEAKDNLSGIYEVYMKEPNSDYRVLNTVRYTISRDAMQGEYEFYVIDKAGNKSPIYYHKLDSRLPIVKLKNISGNDITDKIINKSFYIEANDNESGINKIEIIKPNHKNKEIYYSGDVINSTNENGEYQFTIYDNSRNSVNISVILDTGNPKGIIYAGSSSIGNNSTTNSDYIKFIGIDDVDKNNLKCFIKKDNNDYQPYNSGTLVSDAGKYSFYVVDSAKNKSNEYIVTIDRIAPSLNATVDFGMITGKEFTVNASKSNEIATLFVKEPSAENYIVAPNMSYSVTTASPVGKYYFFAEDSIGNTTNTEWISYQGGIPEAQFILNSEKNTAKYEWSDPQWTGKLNGEPYISGTIIDVEGDYTFTITSETGKSKSYSFTLGHKYEISKVVKPTCQEEGYTEYKCISCGKTFQTSKTPIIEHNFVEQITKPTCVSKGTKSKVCTMCGKREIIEEYDMLDHEYEEIIIEANCETKGCHRHKCKNCGAFYDTDIVEAYGHNYESKIIKPATCTEDGLRHFHCLRCGKEYDQIIKATGHRYHIESEVKNGDKTIRVYVCDECGDSYQEELGDQHSEIIIFIEGMLEKYQPYMWWILLATTGIWSLAIGVTLIIAHKSEDKAKFKRMIINYVIGLIVISMIVVACPYLIKGITSLL